MAESQRQGRGAWRLRDSWEELGCCKRGAGEARQGEGKQRGGKGGKFFT